MFHYDGGNLQKTVLGGMLSIFIEFYIIFVLFVTTKKLLFLEDPVISRIPRMYSDNKR